MWTSATQRRLTRLLTARSSALDRITSSRTSGIVPQSHLGYAHQQQTIKLWSTETKSAPAVNKERPKNTPKRSKPVADSPTFGRISYYDDSRKRQSKLALLCSGCGVEIKSGNEQSQQMAAGHDALSEGRSKRQEKKARYADVLDYSFSRKQNALNAPLCNRCKQLKKGNVWKAYDALRDVDASVFASQLSHISKKRKFRLCLVVVDATDPEFSSVPKLRDMIGNTPCILVLNKVDLLPRMSSWDKNYLGNQIQRRKMAPRMSGVFAVSAETGQGMITLAEGVLNQIQGRDVFVVGAANVGKSTLVKNLSSLLARTLRYKGTSYNKRKDVLQNLNVTSSHLPGTTLQAVRIPCFSSSHHALWDTPGIIQSSSLAYKLFPSHLMEPLAYPTMMEVPKKEDGTRVRVKAGQSILLEAGWVNDHDGDAVIESEPFTLARLDVTEDSGLPVEALAFVPSTLTVRIVATNKAPTEATMPQEYITKIEQRIGAEEQFASANLSRPLTWFKGDGLGVSNDGHISFGFDDARSNGWIDQDIVFASLGFIMLSHRKPFTVRPWVVKDSLFLKRQSIYPTNLGDREIPPYNGHDSYDSTVSDDDREFKEVKQRLRMAYNGGKGNEKKKDDWDDGWY